jgi:LuxR family maltose regulon positive regulatory protein
MTFISPGGPLTTENLDDAPFRFTHKLPLILTKLTPPRTPGTLLQRDRLLTLLDSATTASLTLVCAAAGFGKTTLLAQWYRARLQQGYAMAWLSLEEDDNTPALFIRYLLAALRPMCPALDEASAHTAPHTSQTDYPLFLAQLANTLHTCSDPVFLILDDYHTLSNPEIHHGVSWLVHHAPACLHLIIGSRNRLPFTLSRLQIQEQYVEIDDQSLRFNLAEAQGYFALTEKNTVKQQEIPQLLSLTEGWIAGMKMASLAPHDGKMVHHLAGELRSGSRSITRYLDEVIFAPLPPAVLQFLMQTSILNRLHPDLCDTVTQTTDGKTMLAWIEQHNLFVSALDEGGLWFRYHPLMRDALRARLQLRDERDIAQLHERAGNWLAAQQLWAEAIRHALAAGKSVTLHAEVGAQSLAEEGDIDTMVRWIRYLPATPDPSRVELQLNLAWALAHHFRFDDARQLLDAIDAMESAQRQPLARSTRVKQQVVRAICEAFADNITDSIAIVEPLLAQVPCGDVWVDGLVCNILSYCHLALAQPRKTLDVQQQFPVGMTKKRNMFIEVYRAFVLSLAWLRLGNLDEAERQATQALRLAELQTGLNSSSSATLAPLLAAIAWERGNDAAAHALLTPLLSMIDDVCPADGVSLCYRILARRAHLNGQRPEAQALLMHAEQLSLRRGWWRTRVALLAERVKLLQEAGETHGARQAFDTLTGLARESNNVVARWHSLLSESRLLLAEGKPRVAAARLDEVIMAQEACGETLSALRARLLQAVALWQAGDAKQAARGCTPALALAVEQKLSQSLQDAGPDLPLLLAWMREHREGADSVSGAETLLGIVPQPDTLRLTEREQQTLRLIAEGNSNKAIARTLGISVETVKWHLKQLYEKLDASGRIQAVNQARKLGVLV